MGGVIGGNAISPNFGNGGGAELFSQRIETRIGSVKLIPLNTTIGTAIEIMKFKITKVSGVDKDFYNIFEQAQAEMKRTAGAGFVNCFLESSPDGLGSNWNILEGLFSTNAGFTRKTFRAINNFVGTGELFIRLALYNDDNATSGEINELSFLLDFVIPEGYTFERLI